MADEESGYTQLEPAWPAEGEHRPGQPPDGASVDLLESWGKLIPTDEKAGAASQVIYLKRRGKTEENRLNEIFMGRSSTCDIVVKDQRVSSKHCSLYCNLTDARGPYAGELEAFVQDCSSNGTWLNGPPPTGVHLWRKHEGGMHTRQLRNGDKISLLNPLRKTANDPKGGPVCTSFIFLFTGQNATASLLHGTSSSTVGTNGHASNDKSQSFNRCLHDHYVVKEKIGSGTSGEVMRGLHLASGREVAIKIIPTRQFKLTLPGLTTEEVATEAYMLREIEHPFIIKLEDVFLDDKHVYIVLELVRGGDLFDRIVDRGRYSEDDARELMVRVLTSVSYLHSKDIVHRDLKPENILLVSKENHYDVKITDFGLAKQANKDGLKTFCGTPQYFAPEVLKRRNTVRGAGRYGKEADLWSLGVILYITLSGTHPFHDSTLFDQISKAHYSFDGPEWTNISEDAKDLVKRLLMRNPKKRLTALQALEHPFFRGRGVELTELAGEPAVTVPAPSEDGRLSVAPHSSTDNILDEDDISDFSSDESDCDSDQSDGENPELAPPPVSKRRRKGIAPKKVSGRKPSSEGTSPKPLPMTAAPRRAGSGSRGRLSAPAETRLK